MSNVQQFSSANSSIGKHKVFGEHKNSSVGIHDQQQPAQKPLLPSMMSSLNINMAPSMSLQRQTHRPPASQDRSKGTAVASFSQDRLGSATLKAAQANKVQLTQFGSHGTNYAQIMIPPSSATMPSLTN
jgi:hypothetical protein